MANETLDSSDPREKLRKYLLEQKQRRERMDDPEYRQSVSEDIVGSHDAGARGALAAGLMSSAAQIGSLGGKVTDSSSVGQMADRMAKQRGVFDERMLGEQDAREKRFGVDAKVYEHLAERRDKQDDKETARQDRKDAADERAKDRKETADARAADAKLRRDEMGARRDDALVEKKDARKDKETHTYSETLARSGVPAAVSQLEHVYTMLPAEGDAAGYGRVAGMLPDALVSQKGEDLRQGVQTLFNIELKDRSGAAVTDQELNRLKREFGEGTWKTADQLRKGLASYQRRLKEVSRNINAGVDPSTTKEYVTRGGRDFNSKWGREEKDAKASDTAIAAPETPAAKTPEDMNDAELDAELERLKGGGK
jgi:hypothetical protein